MEKALLIIVFTVFNCFSQEFIKFSDIRDSLDTKIKAYLENNKIDKVTYYFDDKLKKDGKWELYPFVKISDSLYLINVSKIPGFNAEYTFSLLLLKSSKISILDTIGPFYDSYPDEIKIINNKKGKIKIYLKLINPPEPDDESYTIFEYEKIGDKLIKTKK